MASFSHSQQNRTVSLEGEGTSPEIIEAIVTGLGLYCGPELATLPPILNARLQVLFRHALAMAQGDAPEWQIRCAVEPVDTAREAHTPVKETITYLYDFDLGIGQDIIPSGYEYSKGPCTIRIEMRSVTGELLEFAWKAWPDEFCALFRSAPKEERGRYHAYQKIEATITHPISQSS